MAEPKLDWQQVVMNGGPACFALLDDEAGWYCGRAQRWEGHVRIVGNLNRFASR